MSQCPDCGCDLPSFQALCSKCYDARYAEVGRPKSLLESIRGGGSNPRRQQVIEDRIKSTALVAGMVFCCYRPRFGLALRIRVVRWKEYAFYSEPVLDRTVLIVLACAGVALLAVWVSPRIKMASCLSTFLGVFCLFIPLVEQPLDCLGDESRTNLL